MFERWDPDRDIKADVPADFDKLHLFSSLASEIFGDPELAAGVETEWLKNRIREYLEDLYENRSQAAAATKAIVKFITGRAWVMTDVGDGVFAFTHQTFLEYFFARYVDEKADSVGDVLNEITPHVVLREWDVVAHLSLQIKTHRSLRMQNQAIEQLGVMLKETRPADEMRALNLFAARALEYLVASDSQVKALVGTIFSHAVNSIDDGASLRAITYCAFCCAERRSFVRKLLLSLIVEIFTRADEPSMGNLIRAMSSQIAQGNAIVALEVLPSDLRDEAHSAVKRIVLSRAEKSPIFASLAWSWYGLISDELLRKHGLVTYFNTSLEGNRFGVDGLTALVLSGAEYNATKLSFLPEVSEGALAAIGRVGFSSLPLPKEAFNAALVSNTPPIRLWNSMFAYYKKIPRAYVGAFFVFLLQVNLTAPSSENGTERSDFIKAVTASVLNSRGIKKLTIYPDIVRATEMPILTE
jgi:hypothetical protein